MKNHDWSNTGKQQKGNTAISTATVERKKAVQTGTFRSGEVSTRRTGNFFMYPFPELTSGLTMMCGRLGSRAGER